MNMSATQPPAADPERKSNFGEPWQQAERVPHPESVLPESDAPPSVPLTPEQLTRRTRLRRVVGSVVLGLLAFTVLATSIHVAKGRAVATDDAAPAKPSLSAPTEPRAAAAATAAAAPVVTPAAERAPTETERALALARAPVATSASFQTWSELARQLNPSDRKLAEHELSRLSVTAERPVREAARLQLALLWRASERRAKAHKVLVSLARTASDPLVKKVALETLSEA